MPSRKRLAGKARKAKKASVCSSRSSSSSSSEQLGVESLGTAVTINQDLCRCRHGSPPPVTSGEHDFKQLKDFYEVFHNEWSEESIRTNGFLRAATIAVMKTHEAIPEVWNSETLRKKLRDCFLAEGTELILADDFKTNTIVAGAVAACVQMLDQFNPSGECVENFFDLTYRDAFHGCPRGICKFFSKQVPCSCLDKIYADVRSMPKTAVCHSCLKRVERCSIWVCSGCEGQQYCSQKCQADDWQKHKGMCKRLKSKELSIHPIYHTTSSGDKEMVRTKYKAMD